MCEVEDKVEFTIDELEGWDRDRCKEDARANEWLFDEEGNML